MPNILRPLAIDLFCGLGGWAEGFLAEGYDVIGFDIERHDYGTGGYPGQLVLQDVLTLHGSQFKDATVIVASPPCQEFSYRAQPWKRSKAEMPEVLPEWWNRTEKEMRPDDLAEWREWKRTHPLPPPSTALFDACFRIQREAIEATRTYWTCRNCDGYGYQTWKKSHGRCANCDGAGHGYTERHIPLVIENVRGAVPWVGSARWNYGSFYLWGDVPALMPMRGMKQGIAHRSNGATNWHGTEPGIKAGDRNHNGRWSNSFADELKVPGFRFDGSGSFQTVAVKTTGHVSRRDGYSHTRYLTNQRESDAIKQHGSGAEWFDRGICRHSSASNSRKAASAQIAKIPLPLARWIASVFNA